MEGVSRLDADGHHSLTGIYHHDVSVTQYSKDSGSYHVGSWRPGSTDTSPFRCGAGKNVVCFAVWVGD